MLILQAVLWNIFVMICFYLLAMTQYRKYESCCWSAWPESNRKEGG